MTLEIKRIDNETVWVYGVNEIRVMVDDHDREIHIKFPDETTPWVESLKPNGERLTITEV